jgi:hypothetical protein
MRIIPLRWPPFWLGKDKQPGYYDAIRGYPIRCWVWHQLSSPKRTNQSHLSCGVQLKTVGPSRCKIQWEKWPWCSSSNRSHSLPRRDFLRKMDRDGARFLGIQTWVCFTRGPTWIWWTVSPISTHEFWGSKNNLVNDDWVSTYSYQAKA